MDQRGYTLIEVIVLILVLAVLAAIVMTSQGDLSEVRAATLARKLVSDLRYAQQLANTSQVRHGVALTAGSYTMFTNDNSATPATDPLKGGGYIVNLVGEFSGVSLTWANIDSGIVRFDSLGVPYQGIDGAQTLLNPLGTINVQVGASIVKTISIFPTTGVVTLN